MKILALATDAFGGAGGIAQSNRDLFTALAELGHEVTVLPRAGRPATGLPAGVRQLRPLMGRATYSLRALGAGGKYDLLFCGHLYMLPLAALLARARKVPLWLHLHGIEAWTKPSTRAAAAVRRTALVTCVSRYTRSRVLSWSGADPTAVRVLPNAAGSTFVPGARSEKLVAKLGLSGKKIILTVGRISAREKYKGHDRVIEAMPEVLRRYRDAVYVVAGEGSDRPRLETLARSRGVDGSVRFIGPPAESDLPDLYRLADVFVMPSTGEGFGIVFLEAMASGVPVVGGNADGSIDPLQDGLLGRAIDPRSVAAVAGAILSALSEGRFAGTAHPFSRANQQAHLSLLLRRFSR